MNGPLGTEGVYCGSEDERRLSDRLSRRQREPEPSTTTPRPKPGQVEELRIVGWRLGDRLLPQRHSDNERAGGEEEGGAGLGDDAP